jgi:two-component system, cell cycle sensor histidine kinase and response regulator CckA
MPKHSNDSSFRFSGIADFAVRKQIPSFGQILTIFLLVLFVCLTIAVLNLDKVPLILFLFLLLAALGSYMIVLLQRSRDLVMTTEFQNALFASALDYNRTFCLIIKYDGNIVYMDRSFQNLFPNFMNDGHLSLTNLFNHAKTDPAEALKIFDTIERQMGDKVVCNMTASDGKIYKLVISIEPIPRPSGFIMLHAREYIEKRNGPTHSPSHSSEHTLLSKSNVALFSSIMDMMECGLYVVDLDGKLIYANSTLEQWLDYKDHEMVTNKISLRDIAAKEQPNTQAHTALNFDGDAVFTKKTGGVIHVSINQKIIRGDDLKTIGSLAIVKLTTNPMNVASKKLW